MWIFGFLNIFFLIKSNLSNDDYFLNLVNKINSEPDSRFKVCFKNMFLLR